MKILERSWKLFDGEIFLSVHLWLTCIGTSKDKLIHFGPIWANHLGHCKVAQNSLKRFCDYYSNFSIDYVFYLKPTSNTSANLLKRPVCQPFINHKICRLADKCDWKCLWKTFKFNHYKLSDNQQAILKNCNPLSSTGKQHVCLIISNIQTNA